MTATVSRREVSWGDALVVQTFRTQGGLKHVVEVIRAAVGPQIGTRNTFAKLYQVESPDELSERDQFRAWLMLAAEGQEPVDWGLPDSIVPRTMNTEGLKETLREGVRPQGLEPRTRWFEASPRSASGMNVIPLPLPARENESIPA